MRGMFIFQFVIAGMLFFSLLLILISTTRGDVLKFQNNAEYESMARKAIIASDILMKEKLIKKYPFFDEKKIEDFFSNCNDLFLTELFNLNEERMGSITHWKMNIELEVDEEKKWTCGRTVPAKINKYSINRIGILDEKIAKLTVTVW